MKPSEMNTFEFDIYIYEKETGRKIGPYLRIETSNGEQKNENHKRRD